MNRPGRTLLLGCLLLCPFIANAGDNSLLIPITERCTLNVAPEVLPQALEACKQVAETGDMEAEYELGEFYYQSKTSEADRAQALHWYQRASLQGHAQAQYRLGSMYFHGEGVPANNIQAFIVLKMAAVNGAEEALDTADQVSEQMPTEQREIAGQVLGQIFRSYLLELQDAEQLP